jgi:hypothetical protein
MNTQISAMTKALLDIQQQFVDVSDEVMLEALQPNYEKSQEYVPKQTGRLSRSGYLQIAETSRGNPRVEIGYGYGGDPFYTVFVHEMVNIRHEPPTRAKFLQQAIMEDLDGIFKRLGDGYKEFMGGGAY